MCNVNCSQGRFCSCNGGRRVNTLTDEAPRARAPITFAEDHGLLSDKPSMLARRGFWIAAAVALVLWVAAVKAGAYWLVP